MVVVQKEGPNWNWYSNRRSSRRNGRKRLSIRSSNISRGGGNWPWLTSSFVALAESIDLSRQRRRKTWLSPRDAKSSRQIGLTRLYCPHGTTQIIQPRRRLQIYGKVSCNWGNWRKKKRLLLKLKMKKTPLDGGAMLVLLVCNLTQSK